MMKTINQAYFINELGNALKWDIPKLV